MAVRSITFVMFLLVLLALALFLPSSSTRSDVPIMLVE